jgi:hypothetical protein
MSTEARVLEPFKALAKTLGHEYYSGQGNTNRLSIESKIYFQFGDLRIEMPDCTVIIEVESAGGVTNLSKYWECIENNRTPKPIKLLHIFIKGSVNDYKSHIIVWEFLASKMKDSLGSKWESCCVESIGISEEGLAPALKIFGDWLKNSTPSLSIE